MFFMAPCLVFMIPGGFLSSLMVSGWFWSELSAAGAKWDIEIIPWPSDDDYDDDDPLVTQCYTVARTTMGDMTDWEKILWYCLYNCSPSYFFVVHCIEDWAKRRDTEVECFVGSRRTTGWGKQNPSRVPTFLKWSTIALSYSFWEKICLRESFLFWEAISSYSLILEYLLFERVLMFETNWHLFGQNEIVFTRKSVFGRKLC